MEVVKPLPATASGEIAALEEMTILSSFSSSIAEKAYAFAVPKSGTADCRNEEPARGRRSAPAEAPQQAAQGLHQGVDRLVENRYPGVERSRSVDGRHRRHR